MIFDLQDYQLLALPVLRMYLFEVLTHSLYYAFHLDNDFHCDSRLEDVVFALLLSEHLPSSDLLDGY